MQMEGKNEVGYDLHVIRGDEWSDKNRPAIPAEQWLSIVQDDPTLELRHAVTATTPGGETIEYRSEGLTMWTGHGEHPEVPFDFRDGSIVVKNPDGSTIAKLIEVAAKLNARVQGDDGEFYPANTALDPPTGRRRWPFRKS